MIMHQSFVNITPVSVSGVGSGSAETTEVQGKSFFGCPHSAGEGRGFIICINTPVEVSVIRV